MTNAINVIAIVLCLLIWGLITLRLIISKCAPAKTVKAKVFDKYKSCAASKYPGTFKQERYVVVFEAGSRKLSFNVSKFSYNNYRINQKGTLTYKGSKIISFE